MRDQEKTPGAKGYQQHTKPRWIICVRQLWQETTYHICRWASLDLRVSEFLITGMKTWHYAQATSVSHCWYIHLLRTTILKDPQKDLLWTFLPQDFSLCNLANSLISGVLYSLYSIPKTEQNLTCWGRGTVGQNVCYSEVALLFYKKSCICNISWKRLKAMKLAYLNVLPFVPQPQKISPAPHSSYCSLPGLLSPYQYPVLQRSQCEARAENDHTTAFCPSSCDRTRRSLQPCYQECVKCTLTSQPGLEVSGMRKFLKKMTAFGNCEPTSEATTIYI